MKRILLTILVLLTGFLLMTNVKAEEDKTLVIELPSNDVEASKMIISMNIKGFYLISSLFDMNNGSTLVNQEGKEIIKVVVNKDDKLVHFELLDNVTREDCLFEVNDEFIARLQGNEGNVLNGYNKVQFVIKEIKQEDKDTYVIDLSNNIDDFSFVDYLSLLSLADYFGSIENIVTYSNNKGKELVSIISKELDNQNLSIETKSMDGVTKDDDVVIEITNEIKSIATSSNIALNDNTNLIIKFSNFEYSDDGNYIIDMNRIDNSKYIDVTNLLQKIITQNITDELKVSNKIVMKNKDGKILVLFGGSIVRNNPLEFLSIKLGENVTYEDNIVGDVPDVLISLYESLDVDIERIIVKFADPVFLEGKEQTYNIKDKDKMSFRLDIDYDKFLEYGKVYIDDKLLDAKNYEVSKGSTIITLNKDYVTSLKKGEHNIRVEMIDGEVATTFNIVDRVEIIEPIVEAVNKIIVENPETGDKIIICSVLLVLSLMVVIVFRKRRRV